MQAPAGATPVRRCDASLTPQAPPAPLIPARGRAGWAGPGGHSYTNHVANALGSVTFHFGPRAAADQLLRGGLPAETRSSSPRAAHPGRSTTVDRPLCRPTPTLPPKRRDFVHFVLNYSATSAARWLNGGKVSRPRERGRRDQPGSIACIQARFCQALRLAVHRTERSSQALGQLRRATVSPPDLRRGSAGSPDVPDFSASEHLARDSLLFRDNALTAMHVHRGRQTSIVKAFMVCRAWIGWRIPAHSGAGCGSRCECRRCDQRRSRDARSRSATATTARPADRGRAGLLPGTTPGGERGRGIVPCARGMDSVSTLRCRRVIILQQVAVGTVAERRGATTAKGGAQARRTAAGRRDSERASCRSLGRHICVGNPGGPRG